MATKTERHRIIVKRTAELVAAAAITGATFATAIALTATGDSESAVLFGIATVILTWLLNRVAGALFAELGIG